MAPNGVNEAPATLPFQLGQSGTVLLTGPWTVAVDPHAKGSGLGWPSGSFPAARSRFPTS